MSEIHCSFLQSDGHIRLDVLGFVVRLEQKLSIIFIFFLTKEGVYLPV